jgi:flagellar motor component MotA
MKLLKKGGVSMKNKIIGLFIFVFFIFASFVLEGGELRVFFEPSAILIVIGITSGLLLMYYKKGMDRNKLLKKAKQYFVFSGYLGVLISVILVLSFRKIEDLKSFESTIRTIPLILISVLYGYTFAYITDTFIHE